MRGFSPQIRAQSPHPCPSPDGRREFSATSAQGSTPARYGAPAIRAPYAITLGAVRPVRFSISARLRDRAIRSASAAWVSSLKRPVGGS